MTRLLTVALGIMSAGLAGCVATTPVSDLPLETTYQVEWLGERPLVDRSRLTLTLDPSGRAYGTGGCNRWFGRYELAGSLLRIEPGGSTRMACAPALMEQEQRFFDLLSQLYRWDWGDQGELQLWPVEGEPVRLWPAEEQE